MPSASYELSKFLSSLYNDENKINIPSMYERVDQVSQKDLDNNQKLESNAQDLLKHAKIKEMKTESGYDFFTQTGLRPTIQISGIKSGYIEEGFANIVPATAEARLNFRIVASQTAQEVLDKFKEFARFIIPNYVDYKIESQGLHEAVRVNIDSTEIKDIESKLEKSYGKKVINKPVGGAIPFVSTYKELFGLDPVLVSLGNDDCNMHGVNENFKVDLVEKGLGFSRRLFSK